MVRIFSFISAIIILFSIPAYSAPNNSVTIFYTADMNGQLKASPEKDNIDFSYIGGLKNGMPGSLLLDAGNSLSGSLSIEMSQGEKMIELMNLAKYDFVGLGSYDFAYPSNKIAELSKLAEFGLLSSNITKTGKHVLSSTEIKEIDGFKIGFFSLISEETKNIVNRENISEIMFQEIHSIARTCVSSLKADGANAIIALTSLGEKSATDVATLVDGINLIIDSGNNSPIMNGNRVGKLISKTLLVSPGANSVNVGRVDMFFDDNKTVSTFNTSLFRKSDMSAITPNKDIEQIVEVLTAEADKVSNEIIGSSPLLLKKDDKTQIGTTPIGNFIADIFKTQTKADISIVSAGEILADLDAGPITRMDVNNLINSAYTLQTKTITPRLLRIILEATVAKIELDENGAINEELSKTTKFPQISGFKFYYNPKSGVGHKIVKIVLDNGKSLNLNDSKTPITIAATSYLMNGGEEYTTLAGQEKITDQFDGVGIALTDYLRNGGAVTEDTGERAILTEKTESLTSIIVIVMVSVAGLIILLIIVAKLISRIS